MNHKQQKTRYIFLLFLVIIISCATLPGMRFSHNPESESQFITIEIEMEGAWMEEIEEEITIPLEKALSRLKDLKRLRSSSAKEKSSIYLQMDMDSDMDHMYMEVRSILNHMESILPAQAQKAKIYKSKPNDAPIMILLIGQDYAVQDIENELTSTKGCGQVIISSRKKKDLLIEVPEGLLMTHSLNYQSFSKILNDQNQISSFPLFGNVSIVSDQRMKGINDFSNIYLNNGLKSGEIADIHLIESKTDIISRVNGEEQTIAWIYKDGNANTIQLCNEIRMKVKGLPDCRFLYDRGALLKDSLFHIMFLLFISIACVLFMSLYLISNLKTTFIMVMSIPFSLASTLLIFRLFHWNIDIMVLSALAMASGIIVDAVLVYIELGKRESFRVNVSSLLTTLLVFNSFLFASTPLLRDNLNLIKTLTACLISAQIYIYVFMDNILIQSGSVQKNFTLNWVPVFRILKRYRKYSGFVLILSLAASIGGLKSLNFTKKINSVNNALSFKLEYPSGVSKENIASQTQGRELEISKWNGVEYLTVKIKDENASFFISLDDDADKEDITGKIKRIFQDRKAYLYFPEQNIKNEFRITVLGQDRDKLYSSVVDIARLSKEMTQSTSLTLHFKEQNDQLIMIPRYEKLKYYNLSPKEIRNQLSIQMNQAVMGKWYIPQEYNSLQRNFDIRIYDAAYDHFDMARLLKMQIPNQNRRLVSLADLVSLEYMKNYGSIYHYDQRRSVDFTLRDSPFSQHEIEKILQEYFTRNPIDPDLSLILDQNQQVQNYKEDVIKVICIALVLLFLLLILIFESFFLPLVIFIQIVMSHTFTLAILGAFKIPVTEIMVFALVLNTGLLVNNSLILYKRTHNLKSKYSEILISFNKGFRTLLISALTTISGLIPLLFHSESPDVSLMPLALCTATGLIISLLLLILSIPLIFKGEPSSTMQRIQKEH